MYYYLDNYHSNSLNLYIALVLNTRLLLHHHHRLTIYLHHHRLTLSWLLHHHHRLTVSLNHHHLLRLDRLLHHHHRLGEIAACRETLSISHELCTGCLCYWSTFCVWSQAKVEVNHEAYADDRYVEGRSNSFRTTNEKYDFCNVKCKVAHDARCKVAVGKTQSSLEVVIAKHAKVSNSSKQIAKALQRCSKLDFNCVVACDWKHQVDETADESKNCENTNDVRAYIKRNAKTAFVEICQRVGTRHLFKKNNYYLLYQI